MNTWFNKKFPTMRMGAVARYAARKGYLTEAAIQEAVKRARAEGKVTVNLQHMPNMGPTAAQRIYNAYHKY
jgi:hypothetical protein